MDTPLGRLINFLVEWTKNVVEPLVGGRIFNRFAELDGAGLSHIYYYIRFHEHIAPNIAKWDNFNVTTRIRMMFALSGEVPDDFLAFSLELSNSMRKGESANTLRMTET